jgi:hypothetical protein
MTQHFHTTNHDVKANYPEPIAENQLGTRDSESRQQQAVAARKALHTLAVGSWRLAAVLEALELSCLTERDSAHVSTQVSSEYTCASKNAANGTRTLEIRR